MVLEEDKNITLHLQSDICTAPAKSTQYSDLQKSCENLGVYTCVFVEKTLPNSVRF